MDFDFYDEQIIRFRKHDDMDESKEFLKILLDEFDFGVPSSIIEGANHIEIIKENFDKLVLYPDIEFKLRREEVLFKCEGIKWVEKEKDVMRYKQKISFFIEIDSDKLQQYLIKKFEEIFNIE